MGSATAEATAQVEKQCYKNQTAGWLGVVKLDHLGGQVGHSIEPYGTAWLTKEEAILTARAPAQAKDNPFIEQIFQFEDEQGQRVEQPMRPLVLVDGDDGEADRYVPGQDEEEVLHGPHDLNLDAAAAAARDTQTALEADSDREIPTQKAAPVLAPSSAAAVPPSQAKAGAPLDHIVAAEPEEDQRESWVENPDRTEQPQKAALRGSDDSVGPAEGDPAKDGSPKKAPPQRPIRATSTVESADVPTQRVVPSESAGTQKAAGAPREQAKAQVAEEHAGVTEKGEETGAAETPVGKAPEGEFASHEEVGSPDAPTQGAP